MKITFQRGMAVGMTLLAYFAAQAQSFGCATCFGQTDSPLGKGLNWGIFALLTVVGAVLAGICSFFVFIARRAAQVHAEEAQPSTAPQTDSTSSTTV